MAIQWQNTIETLSSDAPPLEFDVWILIYACQMDAGAEIFLCGGLAVGVSESGRSPAIQGTQPLELAVWIFFYACQMDAGAEILSTVGLV